MAITYPLALPDIGIVSADIDIIRNQTAEVGDNGEAQITRKLGDRWAGTITFRILLAVEARDLIGFLRALQGMVGTFTMEHPDYQSMAGTAGGQTGAVKGASQKGNDIITDGWTPGSTFKRGDLIQIGATGAGCRLKTILADATADGSGNATLTVDPPVYQAHADNTAIYTTNCKGYFRLASPNLPIPSDKNRLHTITIAFEEKLP